MSDRDFEALRLVAVDSRLWQIGAGAARAGLAAWKDSRTSAMLRRVAAVLEVLRPAERVRAAALVAVWMGLGHLAFLWMVPAYVAPGLPRSWTVAAVLAALIVASLARPLAVAWTDSTIASSTRTRR